MFLSIIHGHHTEICFWSASEMSFWTNIIHPVYNSTGCNSTGIRSGFPSWCQWHAAVHSLNNTESIQQIISGIQNSNVDIKFSMTPKLLWTTTKIFVLMNKSLRNPSTINKVKIDFICISNGILGAVFDSALISEVFVNSNCKSAWFNFFKFSRSWRYLTTDAARLSKPTWCLKSTIATICCMAFRINHWALFSEFINLLLECTSGQPEVHQFRHITPALAPCKLSGRFQNRTAGL